ncbi:MAG: sugar phosphate nucleotidyltransferase [Candidatus Omnitrophota bacterium]
MKAVILAGGLGTRLRPLTFAIPKPLIPIGEKPILEIIINRLKKFGFNEFIFLVGYRADLIQTYFQDGSKLGVKISYLEENMPLGTAGALSLIRRRFKFQKEESFLLMNGDILTKLNFHKFILHHKKNKLSITIATKRISSKLSYGVLKFDKDKVVGIEEKPRAYHIVNTGIYLIKSNVLKYIPSGTNFSMPELATLLVKKSKKIGNYNFKEYWLAVEHIDHIEEANIKLKKWSEP